MRKSSRPNILWIIADDLCPDLACYGHLLVSTPTTDRLARTGTSFDNVFATSPVCSPTRSALITGMYQTSIGAHQHRTADERKPLLGSAIRPFTEFLRDAGYFVCNGNAELTDFGKTDYNFQHGELYDGFDWRQRSSGQPFFAQVQLFKPHRPFHRTGTIDPDQVEPPPYYPDHPLTRRDWADYLETVEQLDQDVGRVLERLERDGLLEDTAVFFFADQGRAHFRGKQWLYEGGIHVPLLIRWPLRFGAGERTDRMVSLIDLAPTTMELAGVEVPSYMEGRSLLSGSPREYIVAARDRCDETQDRIRCVRNQRFKYIRNYLPERPYTQMNAYKQGMYPVWALMEVLHEDGRLTEEQSRFFSKERPREELYDLQSDPHEVRNLADEDGYRLQLEGFRGLLDRWVSRTVDQGIVLEPPEIIDDWRERVEWGSVEARGLPGDISWRDLLTYWEGELL